jgi:hypothetical protein
MNRRSRTSRARSASTSGTAGHAQALADHQDESTATFGVSDSCGDIRGVAQPSEQPAFLRQPLPLPTELELDGARLNPLSVEDLQYFETRFFLVQGPRSARNPRR